MMHQPNLSRAPLTESRHNSNDTGYNPADDLNNLAKQLDSVIGKLTQTSNLEKKSACNDDVSMKNILHNIVFNRKLRHKFISQDVFSDPAWDILLDLTIAKLDNKKISVSSLCIAASVPTTTALRWIKLLLAEAIIERRPDLTDARRSYIEISEKTFSNMTMYLKSYR